MMPQATTTTTIVGIDLGTPLTTKITLSSTHDHEIVRNAHGGHVTPTSLTFAGPNRPRLLGEDSAEIGRGDENSVWMLDRLLVDSCGSGEDGMKEFARFQFDSKENAVYVPSMEETYDATALVAMLLGRVKRNVLATIQRRSGNNATNDDAELEFVFAVPSNYPLATRQALMDATYAASVKRARVVEGPQCLAAVYQRKFYDGKVVKEEDNAHVQQQKNVMVVEMGHARSCVTILQCGSSSLSTASTTTTEGESDKEPSSQQQQDDEHNNTLSSSSSVQVLSTVSSATLGAANIDMELYHHFQSNHPSLSHTTFNPKSRPAQRLMEGCKKLKHILSMLPEANVTVETIGKNDTDVNLTGNRELLKQLCQESVVNKLKSMIGKAVEEAGGMDVLGEIDSVELTGGGTRIPMIQDTVRHAIGKSDDFLLSKSLDDTSLAFGASLLPSTNFNSDSDDISAEREQRRAQLLEKELAMMKRDVQMVRKDEIRNQIEAHILELRSARHSTHGSLLPSSDEFASYLDENDDWLFSDECEHATVEEMEEKWAQIQAKTQDLAADYLAATRADAERKEKELEEEAQRAAAEQAAEGGGEGEVEDHDNRRLPFKRRMEIVLKNKTEANELFSDGNYQHAAARYAKALSHCSKFFDLSPEQQVEVNDVKLSLYLNLAFAYIKLEKLDNAFLQCNEALKIDSKNVKALYRRATVLYQKRKFDEASKDLVEAGKLAPDDKAVKKLKLLVEKQVMKQKAKEKAMAKKMFG